MAALPSGAPPAPPSMSDTRPPAIDVNIAPQRKVSRNYVADAIDPQKYKWILRQADLGYSRFYQELLDEVAAAADVQADLNTRKLSVAGKAWRCKPASDADADREIAAGGEAFLKRIPSWTDFMMALQERSFRGFSCINPKWISEGSRFWIVDWEAIEHRFFRFDFGDRPVIETFGPQGDLPLPEGLLFYAGRDHAGTLTRAGFGRPVSRFWLYEGYNIIDAASFLEGLAKPHVHLELGPNIKEGSNELERAKDAARAFFDDQISMAPAGVKISLLDAVNKAATFKDMYLAFITLCQRMKTKAILGHPLSTNEGDGAFGDKGSTDRAGQVEQAIVEYEAKGVNEFITTALLAPWTRYHHGPLAAVPSFEVDVALPEDEQKVAATRKTRADTFVVARGLVPLSKDQIYGTLDLVKPASEEDTLAPAAPNLPPGGDAGGDGELPMSARFRTGACPHCAGTFTFAAAEKKKRSLLGASMT